MHYCVIFSIIEHKRQTFERNVTMSTYTIENEQMILEINSAGAEIKSLRRKSDNREYMWCADAKYWGRTAPVLFPVVGSVRDKKYRCDGKEYEMGQHGFARDMEFTVVEETQDSIRFVLEATEETKTKYPYDFALELSYRLDGLRVIAGWKVTNKADGEMHFSVGGHPAFLCPILENTKQTDYYIYFDTPDKVVSDVLEGGLVGDKLKELALDNGYLKITEDLFDDDALVIENNQAKEVALCTPDKEHYLTVKFDAPLFGVWSPVKKNAPFICIEPWYGRADRCDFAGELKDREYGNTLQGKESFEVFYEICISE